MPYVTNVLVCCQTEKAIVRAFMQFLCGRGAGNVHVCACNVRVSVKAQSRVGWGGGGEGRRGRRWRRADRGSEKKT